MIKFVNSTDSMLFAAPHSKLAGRASHPNWTKPSSLHSMSFPVEVEMSGTAMPSSRCIGDVDYIFHVHTLAGNKDHF